MLAKSDRLLSHLARILASASLCLLVSCGSSDDATTPAATTATYSSLWTGYFSGRCSSCHAPGKLEQTAGGPDLSTQAGFYAAMVSVKGSQYPDWDTFVANRASCASKFFIEPSSASTSMIVAAYDSSVSVSPCVVSYHPTEQSITIPAATLTALKEWIDAGAANN